MYNAKSKKLKEKSFHIIRLRRKLIFASPTSELEYGLVQEHFSDGIDGNN